METVSNHFIFRSVLSFSVYRRFECVLQFCSSTSVLISSLVVSATVLVFVQQKRFRICSGLCLQYPMVRQRRGAERWRTILLGKDIQDWNEVETTRQVATFFCCSTQLISGLREIVFVALGELSMRLLCSPLRIYWVDWQPCALCLGLYHKGYPACTLSWM